MASRALGALFALAAALLFATALAGGLVPKVVPGWWDGHPVVQGRELELKAIHVGLLDAYGCNLGGEIKCEELDTNHSLDVVGIAEMAALGLGAFTALLLAISAARIGDRRKLFAKLLLFEMLLISAGAATIFIHGPDLRISIQVLMPVGIGLVAVAAGVGSALLATIAAFRVRREPLRLKPSQSVIQQQQTRQAQQPAFDVRELLREGQGGTPQAPAGNPRPGQVQTHTPLFESAPALRPLYDMQNAGAAPGLAPSHTPPQLEQPTLRVHDEITPGDSASAHVPVAAFVGADPFAPVGGGGRFGAPGERFAYSPPRAIDQTEDLEHELASQPAMPPPMVLTAAEAPTTPMRGNASPARQQRQTGSPRARVPAPERGSRDTKHPTIAAAVPPPPVHNNPPEASTAVEFDAEAKALYQARRDSATDAKTSYRRSDSLFDKSESLISAPLARKQATTDQSTRGGGGDEATGIFAGGPLREPSDATNETSSAPERLDDSTNETMSAPEKRDEDRHAIGFAHTELAPLLTQQQLADLPSSEQPPIDPPPPIQHARVATKPFGRTEPPATPPPSPTPKSSPRAKASYSVPPPSRPGPPPKPTSLPPASAPVAAPFSPRESAPTIGIERIKPEPPEALMSSIERIERGDPTSPSIKEASPFAAAPSAMSASAFATPKRDAPPPASETNHAPDPSAPAAPFPVAPSAAHVAPIMQGPSLRTGPLAPLAARSGPVTASRGLPSPRTGKASVPPPASTSRFAGLSLPKISPASKQAPASEAPERPSASAMPSNLDLSSTAKSSSTASTASTPSPFATIPSPFAAKPSRPSPKPGPGPGPGEDEALTRRVEQTSFEAPTAPATAEHRAAALAEAATQPSADTTAAAAVPLPRVSRPEISTPSDEAATVHASQKPAARATPNRSASTTVQPRPTATKASDIPISTAPPSLPPPKKSTASGPTPACPQCEAPMAWVEEHLRFYCASCRMYF